MISIISADEAAALINDGDTVGITSFTAISLAEDIFVAIEDRYKKEKHPCGLFAFHVSGAGNYNDMGLSHLAHEGLIKKLIGSHIYAEPKLIPLIDSNKIETYCLPQGVGCHLIRSIAGGEDGLLTKVGLHTYADPRQDGCKMNDICKDDIVEVVNINGKEHLFYKAFPINVCLLKGSIADKDGNISLEREPVMLEQLEMAAATKASGGKVIVQVHEIVDSNTLDPRNIKIPGYFVDHIVVGRPKYTFQTHFFEGYHPELTGEKRIKVSEIAPKPLDIRKICGRRGALEIKKNALVNIGGGFSEAVASVAAEEKISDKFLFSVESGIIGGVPVEGAIGIAYNPQVMIRHPECFDLYNGGCLDVSFLGCAQVDQEGNVNVTKFAGKIVGPGGFVNITQNTRKICFLGSFTTGKNDIRINDGKLSIIQDGKINKFVKKVEQISFSGTQAIKNNQDITFITERCVFKLTSKGLMIVEIAPGIDIKKDILDHMDFVPILSDNIKLMDNRIFKEEKMNIIL